MKYWLRKVIFEDRWQGQLEEVIGLCGRAQIDGVLLMEESHLLLMSPWPLEKHRRMAGIYRRMGERLKQEGIRFGVNIASLVGHTDMVVPEEYRLGFQNGWVTAEKKLMPATASRMRPGRITRRRSAGCMPLPDRNAFSWTTISEV